MHVYPGNYEDYLWRKAGGPEAMLAETVVAAPMAEAPAAVVKRDRPRVNPMKEQKIRERLREVEQEVAELESGIQQHEAALGDFKSVEETMRLTEQLAARRNELEARVAEWEELTGALEK